MKKIHIKVKKKSKKKKSKKVSKKKGIGKVLVKKALKRKFQRGKRILSRSEQIQVVQWCVELKSSYQIAELCKTEFGKFITAKAIWRYRASKKWRPVIARLRDRFEKGISKIPIANKVDRLKYLQEIKDLGTTWFFVGTDPFGRKKYKMDLGAAKGAVDSAREEREPHKGTQIKVGVGVTVNLTPEQRSERVGDLRALLSIK